MRRLEGKVALITGGTSGIGAATLKRFVSEGAKVVFTGSRPAAPADLAGLPGTAYFQSRVQEPADWEKLSAFILEKFGRLDIAFANAGMEGGDTNIEDVSIEAWNQIVAVNQTGPMLTAKYAIKMMRKNEGQTGSIIINSSMSGILALPGNVGYSTTKGALRLLTRSVAVYTASKGTKIRCNAIMPGIVETHLIREAIETSPDPKAARAIFEGMSPMHRMAQPDEIASLVVFLASDESTFISGAEYSIDGASSSGMHGV